jgi:hypothetical protein
MRSFPIRSILCEGAEADICSCLLRVHEDGRSADGECGAAIRFAPVRVNLGPGIKGRLELRLLRRFA